MPDHQQSTAQSNHQANNAKHSLQNQSYPSAKTTREGKKPPIQAKHKPIQRNTGDDDQDASQKNASSVEQFKAKISKLMNINIMDADVNFNSAKPAQYNAEATAQDKTVDLAPGKEHHLGHELTHIAQQKQGRVQPTIQANSGVGINNDPKLEKEANDVGKMANEMSPIQMHSLTTRLPTKFASTNAPIQLQPIKGMVSASAGAWVYQPKNTQKPNPKKDNEIKDEKSDFVNDIEKPTLSSDFNTAKSLMYGDHVVYDPEQTDTTGKYVRVTKINGKPHQGFIHKSLVSKANNKIALETAIRKHIGKKANLGVEVELRKVTLKLPKGIHWEDISQAVKLTKAGSGGIIVTDQHAGNLANIEWNSPHPSLESSQNGKDFQERLNSLSEKLQQQKSGSLFNLLKMCHETLKTGSSYRHFEVKIPIDRTKPRGKKIKYEVQTKDITFEYGNPQPTNNQENKEQENKKQEEKINPVYNTQVNLEVPFAKIGEELKFEEAENANKEEIESKEQEESKEEKVYANPKAQRILKKMNNQKSALNQVKKYEKGINLKNLNQELNQIDKEKFAEGDLSNLFTGNKSKEAKRVFLWARRYANGYLVPIMFNEFARASTQKLSHKVASLIKKELASLFTVFIHNTFYGCQKNSSLGGKDVYGVVFKAGVGDMVRSHLTPPTQSFLHNFFTQKLKLDITEKLVEAVDKAFTQVRSKKFTNEMRENAHLMVITTLKPEFKKHFWFNDMLSEKNKMRKLLRWGDETKKYANKVIPYHFQNPKGNPNSFASYQSKYDQQYNKDFQTIEVSRPPTGKYFPASKHKITTKDHQTHVAKYTVAEIRRSDNQLNKLVNNQAISEKERAELAEFIKKLQMPTTYYTKKKK